ncbi:hypothetical protein JAO77_20090 [Hymenobacter sp. BT559]|nr:hypothetical protein [Hymenobacter sp. BT559]
MLPITWWWELFDDQKMTPYFRAVRTISGQMLAAGRGQFQPFAVQASVVQSFGMRCGNKYFIYLLNDSPTATRVPVSFGLSTTQRLRVQAFAPAGQQFAYLGDFTAKNQRRTLPAPPLALRQEVVLVLEASPKN